MINYLHILEVFHTFNGAGWSLLLTKFTYLFLLLYFYLAPIRVSVHDQGRIKTKLGLMLLPSKGLFSSWHGRPSPKDQDADPCPCLLWPIFFLAWASFPPKTRMQTPAPVYSGVFSSWHGRPSPQRPGCRPLPLFTLAYFLLGMGVLPPKTRMQTPAPVYSGKFSSWHGRPSPQRPGCRPPPLFSLAYLHIFVKFHSPCIQHTNALIMPVVWYVHRSFQQKKFTLFCAISDF